MVKILTFLDLAETISFLDERQITYRNHPKKFARTVYYYEQFVNEKYMEEKNATKIL